MASAIRHCSAGFMRGKLDEPERMILGGANIRLWTKDDIKRARQYKVKGYDSRRSRKVRGVRSRVASGKAISEQQSPHVSCFNEMKSRIDDGSGLGLGALLISRNGLRKGALRKCAPLPGIHSGKVAAHAARLIARS